MASYVQATRLRKGNLIKVGNDLFRILELHRQKPYISGLVEVFEDRAEQRQTQIGHANQASELFNAYLQALIEVIGKEAIEFALPTIPEELSHFIAYFLDVSNERKQQLLELTSTTQRLEEEIDILRHEVPFMRQMLSPNNSFHPESPDRSMLN